MKCFIIILLGLLSAGSGLAQDSVRHHFSLSYANNAQISGMVHDLYFKASEDPKQKQSIFKICGAYSFESKRGFEFGIQVGFGQRQDIYTREIPAKKALQKYYAIMPFALKTLGFNRFSISIGGGIPLNSISTYDLKGNDYLDKAFHNTFEGGFTIGLNSITQLRFYLTPRWALTSSIQFGWMYAELGGKYQQKPVDPDYMPVWFIDDYRTARKSFFTQPEFLFGIGFSI